MQPEHKNIINTFLLINLTVTFCNQKPRRDNRYSYCVNNPLKYSDPSGKKVFNYKWDSDRRCYVDENDDPVDWSDVYVAWYESGNFMNGSLNMLNNGTIGGFSGYYSDNWDGSVSRAQEEKRDQYKQLVTLIIAGMDNKALLQFYAIVIGESSNNALEAQGIGEVMLNRLDWVYKNSDNPNATVIEKLVVGFIDKIGHKGAYDAIGGNIYNDIMKMNLRDVMLMDQDSKYYRRSLGASESLFNWIYGGKGVTGGAYFWNATFQRYAIDVGSNWRAYNDGLFVITAIYGGTTFFRYADNQPNVWP